jgi:SAM-dependent methyltransferase
LKKKNTRAARADKHDLYEAAVQDVESEIDFVTETWESLRPRKLVRLREDFAGTSAAACEFVKRDTGHHAWAVDIDPEVLEWGRSHRVGKLDAEAQQRIELIEADVLEAETPPADVVMAMNFSYWMFKTRDSLRHYFERARDALADDGMLMLDAFGGYDAYRELTETRDCGRFTYVWHHERYDPITGDMDTRIDFKFPDGSKLKGAFTYHWRLWSLPELRELLEEAGFSKVTIYWQGWDEDGEADGEFEPAEHGEADAGWIVYIVAEK